MKLYIYITAIDTVDKKPQLLDSVFQLFILGLVTGYATLFL